MIDRTAPIPSYDFLTLGETLLRLSPPGMQRLDQARNFEVGIGGSELNVACMLARLGRRTAWVSRLPEGPLGRIVDGEARRHGVDTRFVRWIPEARLGLMFFEPGPAPRNARALMRAKQLGGEIKYLSQGEIDARNRGYRPYSTETWRTWEYWANKAGCGHLLTRPDDGHAHPPKE